MADAYDTRASLGLEEAEIHDEQQDYDDVSSIPSRTPTSYIVDALHFSAAFSVLEGCVIAVLTLAPTTGNVGAISSGTLYFTFAFANLIAPAIVYIITPKWAIVVGMFAYELYIIAYALVPSVTDALVIPASAISGIGAACIWTGYGVYITATGAEHARLKQKPQGGSMGLFNGMFSFTFQLCLLGGQVVSSLVLSATSSDDDSSGMDSTLFIIFVVVAGIASVAMIFLRGNMHIMATQYTTETVSVPEVVPDSIVPPHSSATVQTNGGYTAEKDRDEKADVSLPSTVYPLDDNLSIKPSATAMALKTMNHFLNDTRMQLLTLSNIAFGLTSGFQNGAFVVDVVSPYLGNDLIGYTFACNFAVAALWSFPLGWLSDKYSRAPGMVLGYLSTIIVSIVCLTYTFQEDDIAVIFTLSALLGISQGTWHTLNGAVFSEYFEDSPDSAFGNLKFWSGISTAVAFYVYPYMTMDEESYLIIAIQTAGLIGFFVASAIDTKEVELHNS
eukprot:CFRG2952T1